MSEAVVTVIMAGGVGERFWPWSRRKRPKQLLDLTGNGAMLALTLDRACAVSAPEDVLIVTNRVQRDAVVALVGKRIPGDNVIAEPVGRNTAPCVALAAVWIEHYRGNRPMLVLPADHLVSPVDEFVRQVEELSGWLKGRDELVTFGIRPGGPETGYGYIESAEAVAGAPASVRRVAAFLEKPSLERARRFVAGGTHFWNSGMFLWNSSTILTALERHMPELAGVVGVIRTSMGTKPLPEVLDRVYPAAPAQSIDYGVMEKADDVVMVEAGFDWNDVGSWEFMREGHIADGNGNVSLGNHVFIDAARNTVVSPDRLVAVLGLDEIAVVDAGDTVLVCPRDRVQDVKKVVEALREAGRDDLL